MQELKFLKEDDYASITGIDGSKKGDKRGLKYPRIIPS